MGYLGWVGYFGSIHKSRLDGFCVVASGNGSIAVGRSVLVTNHQSPSSGAAKGGHDGAYLRMSAWRLRRHQRVCLVARHQVARDHRHGDYTDSTWLQAPRPQAVGRSESHHLRSGMVCTMCSSFTSYNALFW